MAVHHDWPGLKLYFYFALLYLTLHACSASSHMQVGPAGCDVACCKSWLHVRYLCRLT
jgi:hypothetical protein